MRNIQFRGDAPGETSVLEMQRGDQCWNRSIGPASFAQDSDKLQRPGDRRSLASFVDKSPFTYQAIK
jgi:hypothetical protein